MGFAYCQKKCWKFKIKDGHSYWRQNGNSYCGPCNIQLDISYVKCPCCNIKVRKSPHNNKYLRGRFIEARVE